MLTKQQKLTVEKYRNELDQGKMLASILTGDSHMEKEHIGINKTKMMNRLLSESKSVSSFIDMETAKSYIVDVMYARMDQIVEWKDGKEQKLALSVPFGEPDDPAQPQMGQGFLYNASLKSITLQYPNTVNVILKKDRSVPTYGFSLYTAYPAMDRDATRCRLSPGNMLNLIRSTKTYEKADNIKKGYYDYHALYKNPQYKWDVSCTENRYIQGSVIKIKFPYNEKMHEIKIDSQGVSSRAWQAGVKMKADEPFNVRDGRLVRNLNKIFPDNANALNNMLITALPDHFKPVVKNRAKTAVNEAVRASDEALRHVPAQTGPEF